MKKIIQTSSLMITPWTPKDDNVRSRNIIDDFSNARMRRLLKNLDELEWEELEEIVTALQIVLGLENKSKH